MFDSLVRNIESVSKVAKAAACCVLGVATVWRGYAVISDVGSLYAMLFCILFAFSMVGIGVSMITEGQEG